MTTPLLQLTEMANAQSQPHVVVNDAIRALEVFGQIVAISMDQTAPPGSVSEGDVYLLDGAPTGDWSGHAYDVAYYSGGWQFFSPREGWKAFVIAEDGTFRFDGATWIIDTPASGAVDASDVTYTPANGFSSPDTDHVNEALDDLFNAVDELSGAAVDASGVTYTPANAETSGGTDHVNEALDDLFNLGAALKEMGIAFSVAGKPGDGAVYNILIPIPIVIPASLTGTSGHSGDDATGSSVFSLSKNGAAAFGTLTFTSGGSSPSLAAASPTSFAAGDRLTITCPTPQDATLADVGFTIKGTRVQ